MKLLTKVALASAILFCAALMLHPAAAQAQGASAGYRCNQSFDLNHYQRAAVYCKWAAEELYEQAALSQGFEREECLGAYGSILLEAAYANIRGRVNVPLGLSELAQAKSVFHQLENSRNHDVRRLAIHSLETAIQLQETEASYVEHR